MTAKKKPGQKKKRVGGAGHDDATKQTKRAGRGRGGRGARR